MKIRLKATFILAVLTITLSFGQGFSQTPERIPLVDVLDSLEQKFEVKFSYVDAHIRDIYLSEFPACLKFELCIQALEGKMNLKFEVLNERFITIAKIDSNPQALCGVVVNSETKEKLHGAIVLINDRFLLSDKNGRFIIDQARPTDTATIQYLGYHIKKISVEQLQVYNCIEISLSPIVTILKEVTVQNYLVKGIDKKVDGSLSIDLLNMEILPGLTEPDILHTVQKLPGIHSINETVSDINVR